MKTLTNTELKNLKGGLVVEWVEVTPWKDVANRGGSSETAAAGNVIVNPLK